MKKRMIALMAGLASLVGIGSMSRANVETLNTKADYSIKAKAETKAKRHSTVRTIGGLDLVTVHSGRTPGLSPKEYGLRFGNGKSRKGKSNRNRYAHNAKVSNRNRA